MRFTTVGYAGGKTENPTYPLVCSGTTGHAETVELEYDPHLVSYQELLNKFWTLEDPTADYVYHSGQYRNVIFYFDEEQRKVAEASKRALQPKFNRPIKTEILPAPKFWRAEDYHQNYYQKNHLGVCR